MVAAFAVALALAAPPPTLDPKRLPTLPTRGLARDAGNAVVLETLHGRPIGRLSGYRLAIPRATHGLWVTNGRGTFLIDSFGHRARPVVAKRAPARGCRTVDATMRTTLLLCGRRIDVILAAPNGSAHRTVLARAPDPGGGSWEWAEFGPNGREVLAEWSGECELPTAFLISGGKVRPYGASTYAHAPESEPLGWLPDGRAVVKFDTGACGSGIPKPGVYAVTRGGHAELLRATGRTPVALSMWGG